MCTFFITKITNNYTFLIKDLLLASFNDANSFLARQGNIMEKYLLFFTVILTPPSLPAAEFSLHSSSPSPFDTENSEVQLLDHSSSTRLDNTSSSLPLSSLSLSSPLPERRGRSRTISGDQYAPTFTADGRLVQPAGFNKEALIKRFKELKTTLAQMEFVPHRGDWKDQKPSPWEGNKFLKDVESQPYNSSHLQSRLQTAITYLEQKVKNQKDEYCKDLTFLFDKIPFHPDQDSFLKEESNSIDAIIEFHTRLVDQPLFFYSKALAKFFIDNPLPRQESLFQKAQDEKDIPTLMYLYFTLCPLEQEVPDLSAHSSQPPRKVSFYLIDNGSDKTALSVIAENLTQ